MIIHCIKHLESDFSHYVAVADLWVPVDYYGSPWEEPEKLYHATAKKNLESVRRNGLLLHRMSASTSSSRGGEVCFFTEEVLAEWAAEELRLRGKQAAILTVDWKKLRDRLRLWERWRDWHWAQVVYPPSKVIHPLPNGRDYVWEIRFTVPIPADLIEVHRTLRRP